MTLCGTPATVPAIRPAPVDWSELQPACDVDDCDHAAEWVVTIHECARSDFIQGILCDRCLTESRTAYERMLPMDCVCDIRWVSWRDMCPKQVRL